jgi:hypothetical protein
MRLWRPNPESQSGANTGAGQGQVDSALAILLWQQIIHKKNWQAWKDDLGNYMMSEECLRTSELVAAL